MIVLNMEKSEIFSLTPRKVLSSTISSIGIVQFWSRNKAVVNVFPHKAEPSHATRTGLYLLD